MARQIEDKTSGVGDTGKDADTMIRKKRYVLSVLILFLASSGAIWFFLREEPVKDVAGAVQEEEVQQEKEYTLELERFSIANDGTNAEETTAGFNEALKWASEEGYTVFKVPAGTYLIRKGEAYDPEARINMVSNMTFWLDDDAIIQKEANGEERYETLYIGPGIENVTIRGGVYRGDRDEHDYSEKEHADSPGTHESGYGIFAEGASNLVVEDVTAEQFTGDGMLIGGNATGLYDLSVDDFEEGGIDAEGKPVEQKGLIRSRTIEKTNFDAPVFSVHRSIQLSSPVAIDPDTTYQLFYYTENDEFIGASEQLKFDWSLAEAPENAAYFHVVMEAELSEEMNVQYWAKIISTDALVRNSTFAFNRRQGITVGGVKGIEITSSVFHDQNGIAPQSGIDVEAGFFPNESIVIRNNEFYNNASYDIILYDGKDALVEGNTLSSDSIGLAVSEPFSGALVKNNVFDGSDVQVTHDTEFSGNEFTDSSLVFHGPNVVLKGMNLTNSQLTLSSPVPGGIEVTDLTMNHTGTGEGLVLLGEPITIDGLTMTGEGAMRNISGSIKEGSTFSNFVVDGYNGAYGLDLPPGNYSNCVFRSSDSGAGGLQLNDPGVFAFNECEIESGGLLFEVANEEASVTIEDSVLKAFGGFMGISAASVISIENNEIRTRQAIEESGLLEVPGGVDASITGNTVTVETAE